MSDKEKTSKDDELTRGSGGEKVSGDDEFNESVERAR